MLDRDSDGGKWDIGIIRECHSRFWPSQLDSSVIMYERVFCVTAVLSHHDALLCQLRVPGTPLDINQHISDR